MTRFSNLRTVPPGKDLNVQNTWSPHTPNAGSHFILCILTFNIGLTESDLKTRTRPVNPQGPRPCREPSGVPGPAAAPRLEPAASPSMVYVLGETLGVERVSSAHVKSSGRETCGYISMYVCKYMYIYIYIYIYTPMYRRVCVLPLYIL